MTKSRPASIVTIGNAIVDIVTRADDDFITAQGMTKSAMNLVDLIHLRRFMMPLVRQPKFPAARRPIRRWGLFHAAAMPDLWQDAHDTLGRIFEHDITAAGVVFPAVYDENSITASSIIIVTPDTERTMNTHLGPVSPLARMIWMKP